MGAKKKSDKARVRYLTTEADNSINSASSYLTDALTKLASAQENVHDYDVCEGALVDVNQLVTQALVSMGEARGYRNAAADVQEGRL